MWYNTYWGQIPLTLSMPGKTANKMAKLQNNIEFQNYFERLFLMAQNRFVWKNNPSSCDNRFMERMFLLCGKTLIANTEGGLISLGAANSGEINIHGWPLRCYGWGLNGYNKEFSVYVPGADDSSISRQGMTGLEAAKKPEAVVIYDNPDGYPYVMFIIQAARRLANIMRATDVAVENLKNPFVVTCDEENVKSVREALQQRQDNVAAIIALKGSFSPENFKIWPTAGDTNLLQALWTTHCNIDSEILLTLGQNANSQSDKRERLIVPEVQADNGIRAANINVELEWRKKGCEWVNEVFGENWDVEINEDNPLVKEDGVFDDPDRLAYIAQHGDPVSGDED